VTGHNRDSEKAKTRRDSKNAKRGVLDRTLATLDRMRGIPVPTPLQILEKIWPDPSSDAVAAQAQPQEPRATSEVSVCHSSSVEIEQQVPVVPRGLSPSERIESSDRTMITSVTEQETMKADKGQFDEVLRRMLAKNPKKTADIKQAKLGFRRKKNPETDPVKLAIAEDEVLTQIKMTPELAKTIRLTDEHDQEYRKKKKS